MEKHLLAIENRSTIFSLLKLFKLCFVVSVGTVGRFLEGCYSICEHFR